MTTLIVMPTYNGSEFLGAAIAGVRAQTEQDWRLIVVEDGSEGESSWSIIQHHAQADTRILSVRHGENQGIAVSRNDGYEFGRNGLGFVPPFVMMLDHDDVLLPEALATLIAALNARPDVLAVMGQTYQIDEAGQTFVFTLEGEPQREFPWNGITPGETFGFFDLYSARPMYRTMGQFLLRGTDFEAAQGFDPDYQPADDVEFWLRTTAHGRTGSLPCALHDCLSLASGADHEKPLPAGGAGPLGEGSGKLRGDRQFPEDPDFRAAP